jgi:UDP-N-acetyl-D-glucosamine dehydrogenase
VIGLGFAGLQMAIAFAESGFHVVAFDTDQEKVAKLRDGLSYLPDIGDDRISASLERLSPTSVVRDLRACASFIVSVQTPPGPHRGADLTHVNGAIHTIARVIQPGGLVLIQSTVPPGTAKSLSRELASRLGLNIGEQLFVAAAPERADAANEEGWTIRNTPRVVGGVTPACGWRAAELLRSIVAEVIVVSNATVAETSKLIENSFRLVNLALAYDFEAACRELEISTREVIQAAATKPFGFLAHYPGTGIGGECIPVNPSFLLECLPTEQTTPSILETALQYAERRPGHVIQRLSAFAGVVGTSLEHARILIVGVAYKPEANDTRNSPARPIIRQLIALGATVAYSDPYVESLSVDGTRVRRVEFSQEIVQSFHIIVVVTPHQELLSSGAWQAAPAVFDPWDLVQI